MFPHSVTWGTTPDLLTRADTSQLHSHRAERTLCSNTVLLGEQLISHSQGQKPHNYTATEQRGHYVPTQCDLGTPPDLLTRTDASQLHSHRAERTLCSHTVLLRCWPSVTMSTSRATDLGLTPAFSMDLSPD